MQMEMEIERETTVKEKGGEVMRKEGGLDRGRQSKEGRRGRSVEERR